MRSPAFFVSAYESGALIERIFLTTLTIWGGLDTRLRRLSKYERSLQAMPIRNTQSRVRPRAKRAVDGVDSKIPGTVAIPDNVPGDPTLLYIHGGGYVVGTPSGYLGIAGYFATMLGARLYA